MNHDKKMKALGFECAGNGYTKGNVQIRRLPDSPRSMPWYVLVDKKLLRGINGRPRYFGSPMAAAEAAP